MDRAVVMPVLLLIAAISLSGVAKIATPNAGIRDRASQISAEEFASKARLAQIPLALDLATSSYGVEGVTVGSRLPPGSDLYREYQCRPSEQFSGFTWCTKQRNDRERRGKFEASYSILRAPDGTVAYVNRFQKPAFLAPTEVHDDIDRYSRNLAAPPRTIEMPERPGLPKGIIATWGKASLELLDRDSLRMLAEGRSVKQGLLVDFIADFSRSAREGLPVFRISGGGRIHLDSNLWPDRTRNPEICRGGRIVVFASGAATTRAG
jgi:hypothetical protein